MLIRYAVIILFCYSIQCEENKEISALIEEIWGKNPNSSTTDTSRNQGSETTSTPCECVLYYLCNNGTINTNGGGIIDIR